MNGLLGPNAQYFLAVFAAVCGAQLIYWGLKDLYRMGLIPTPRQWWMMGFLGYGWRRHRFEKVGTSHTNKFDEAWLQVWKRSDGLWYAEIKVWSERGTDSLVRHEWESEIGFDSPVTAHVHASTNSWGATHGHSFN